MNPTDYQDTVIIAIDGPSGSGKGTISKRLSQILGYDYLDTGKLYRALAYLSLREGVSDTHSLVELSKQIDMKKLAGIDLSTEEIGQKASEIAHIPQIREALDKLQREFVVGKPGAILDGRDIGTVIFPNAQVKLFVTATLEERAARRFKQLQTKNKNIIYEQVFKELSERDQRDKNRKTSPLSCAKDAMVIDTTNLSVDESIELIMKHLKSKLNLKI